MVQMYNIRSAETTTLVRRVLNDFQNGQDLKCGPQKLTSGENEEQSVICHLKKENRRKMKRQKEKKMTFKEAKTTKIEKLKTRKDKRETK